ncbi:MAG: cytochrome c oxidase assembly protein [Alphaproteobacteria bacterium]|nr:cytochrome c oxidase assembly protein [Alphaproteobacteria bacterium]
MDRNARTAFLCFSLAAGMIGAAYAAVPFYRWFCQVTGFEGTTQRADAAPDASGISDRVIRVRFDANVAPGLTWNFGPVDPYIDIRVGDVGITSYFAQNTGSRSTRGHSTFNVTPEKAGKYFVKVACFCFEDQPLKANESREMPVNFFIDPAILDDRRADDITEITLSYTFFAQDEQTASAEAAAATN